MPSVRTLYGLTGRLLDGPRRRRGGGLLEPQTPHGEDQTSRGGSPPHTHTRVHFTHTAVYSEAAPTLPPPTYDPVSHPAIRQGAEGACLPATGLRCREGYNFVYRIGALLFVPVGGAWRLSQAFHTNTHTCARSHTPATCMYVHRRRTPKSIEIASSVRLGDKGFRKQGRATPTPGPLLLPIAMRGERGLVTGSSDRAASPAWL